jgi:site-specific DNA-methyltransferase (adenine-specific)
MISKALFSSASDEWSTSQDLFDRCARQYGPFNLDVCATKENAKCARYFTREDDGLERVWDGCCWMNPPYGRLIGMWIDKAYKSVKFGVSECVVCLLPARTDTCWFHDIIQPYAKKIEFVRGRLKFGDSKHSAPFPSMIVVFARNVLESRTSNET